MRVRFGCKFLFVFCLIAAGLPLAGCGGGDMTPQGPEMGALQKYMDEHPELAEENDEAIDQEDEFAGAAAE